MLFLYNNIILFCFSIARLLYPFNKKVRLFFNGQKGVFSQIQKVILLEKPVIWIHVASLGEFEQGLPLLERLKIIYPSYFFLLTFFSPSGYEVVKNKPVADGIVYLPIDTRKNVRRFLDIVKPQKVFFVKYEFWPNYLTELQYREIETFLVSAVFRENQLFFKKYGAFYKKLLYSFTNIFVQEEPSKTLLERVGIRSVVCGDTRFDRVSQIIDTDFSLPIIETFKANTLCIVMGSVYSKEQSTFLEFLNHLPKKVTVIIAPHNTNNSEIKTLLRMVKTPFKHYSQICKSSFKEKILVIDSVGLLTKIYKYADIAFVGGGFRKKGLHNILEPAIFGIPVIIGKHYNHFREASELVHLKGVTSIENSVEFRETIETLILEPDLRKEQGDICKNYIKENKGATERIIREIK